MSLWARYWYRLTGIDLEEALARIPRMGSGSLAGGFRKWPAGQDALMDAIECVILDRWRPGTTAEELGEDDANMGELYHVYRRLTGWTPEEAAARNPEDGKDTQ